MSPMNEVLAGKHAGKKLKPDDGAISIILNKRDSLKITSDLVDGFYYFKKENGYEKYGVKMKVPSKIHYAVLKYKNDEKSMLILEQQMYELLKSYILQLEDLPEDD